MISKILYNKYAKKVKLDNIKVSNNKEFLIWEFKGDSDTKIVGFSPVSVYYGGKTHSWYSILIGYFLPYSYTIKFDNVIGKECYITTNAKGVVQNIIPLVNSTNKSTQTTEKESLPKEPEPEIESNEDLFE